MLPYQPWDKPIEVALLAEGVDRNNLMQGLMDGLPTSPFLAEGVDRNLSSVVGGAG